MSSEKASNKKLKEKQRCDVEGQTLIIIYISVLYLVPTLRVLITGLEEIISI